MDTSRKFVVISLCVLSLLLLAGCAPGGPLPTRVPTLGPITASPPEPTALPTPTPTATPIPPATLIIRWPAQISAMQPAPIEVELIPPPGVDVTVTISVAVRSPTDRHYWQADLVPKEGFVYTTEEPLRLPLVPPAGRWRLLVYVQSSLRVEGQRALIFWPTDIRFWDLAGVLPAGTDIRVPQDFAEVVAVGDRAAGGRAWRYSSEASSPGDASPYGEVSLWWAPGPYEPLQLNNAVVMLETTYGVHAPEVTGVEETAWRDQKAFLFHETWPGAEGGPGEAWVIQGPDYWLYVLRVRALGGGSIPPLLQQVRDTLTFAVDE